MNKLMILCSFLSFLFLSACAGNHLVKTYSGDELPESQVVKLSAGEHLQIVKVNGEPVQEYLLGNLNLDYALKPGKNSVVFQYESVWAQSSVGDDGKKTAVVLSDLREVEFIASAGDRVSFQYPSASNVRDARKLAKTFNAKVVNQRGEVLANSGDLGDDTEPEALTETVAAVEKIEHAVVDNDEGNQESADSNILENSLPKIEALKVLWNEMSVQEQKDFLKWAFQ